MTEISSKWITSKLFSSIYKKCFKSQESFLKFPLPCTVVWGHPCRQSGVLTVGTMRHHSAAVLLTSFHPSFMCVCVRRSIIHSCVSSQVINKCSFCRVHAIDTGPLANGLKLATHFPHGNEELQLDVSSFSPMRQSVLYGVDHKSTFLPLAHSGEWNFYENWRQSISAAWLWETSFDHKEKKFLDIK